MTQEPQAIALIDRFGRSKRKLRVSLTDRCNFRCPYCMPESPQWLPTEQLLRFDERLRLLQLVVSEFGIREIRLTGGEPLLYPQLPELLQALQGLRADGLQRIALTTNAYLLERHAEMLKQAGLDDLNVSLDALDPPCFERLSGGRSIQPVLAGIDAARQQGLPIKINSVLIHGHNADQLWPLVDWAADRQLPLRFIEFMPLDGRGAWQRNRVVTATELLAQLAEKDQLVAEAKREGPAQYYWLRKRQIRIGMIPTVSQPFCGDCDRLRVTAEGQLLACLFSNSGPQLMPLLRNTSAGKDAQLKALIRQAVWAKDEGYVSRPGYTERPISMHGIGG